MLFNSFEYIFVFLPLSLLGYYALCRIRGIEQALGFLLLASLAFYAWWNPVYLLLFVFSIVVNNALGQQIGKQAHVGMKKIWLVTGIILNLALLGYFKYFNFIVHNVETLTGYNWNLEQIILQLAISFFTFQQIAYLVDAYRAEVREYSFVHYALFVSFFPQLIAGPIVHHKEMQPQFFDTLNLSPRMINFAVGISIFSLGLFKKTVIADNLSTFDGSGPVDFVQAWTSALAYTFQLYFDFSGYSDMAVGSARLFGIKLPINFFSHYKSTSIIEFWRRWHITLSRFLRDYLYFPLGGNRNGSFHRYRNLFLTMLLGGIWHGAGWTFFIWGAAHGIFLIINHGWRHFLDQIRWHPTSVLYITFAWLMTFVAIVFSWVYFRAPNVERAHEIISGMIGLNGAILPSGIAWRIGEFKDVFISLGFEIGLGSGSILLANVLWITVAAVIALALPN